MRRTNIGGVETETKRNTEIQMNTATLEKKQIVQQTSSRNLDPLTAEQLLERRSLPVEFSYPVGDWGKCLSDEDQYRVFAFGGQVDDGVCQPAKLKGKDDEIAAFQTHLARCEFCQQAVRRAQILETLRFLPPETIKDRQFAAGILYAANSPQVAKFKINRWPYSNEEGKQLLAFWSVSARSDTEELGTNAPEAQTFLLSSIAAPKYKVQ